MGRSIVSDPLEVGHPILNRNRHIVLQEVGSDSSDKDDIPLAKLASINSSSDSDSNMPLSKLRNK